jgi:hypothetical protein
MGPIGGDMYCTIVRSTAQWQQKNRTFIQEVDEGISISYDKYRIGCLSGDFVCSCPERRWSRPTIDTKSRLPPMKHGFPMQKLLTFAWESSEHVYPSRDNSNHDLGGDGGAG